MSLIVAGNFANKADADRGVEALRAAGIQLDRICSFRVNPPGQHGGTPIGGDEYASPGAENAGAGALSGAAIGGAIGMGAGIVAIPIAGPAGLVAGPALGAFVGSLAGGLNKMGDDDEADKEDAKQNFPAGLLVAVDARDEESGRVADLLRQQGARDVEETEGTWRDGMWIDFDPLDAKREAQQRQQLNRQ